MLPQLLKCEQTAGPLSRQALHEVAVAFAMEQFDRWGECQPKWIIAAGPNVAWFETPFLDEQHKSRTAFCMQALMRKLPAHAYSIIVEAFIAKIDKDTDIDSIGPLCDLPKSQRDEVLLVQTFDRDGGCDATRFLVTVRRPIGPNFLGPRDDETFRGMEMAGRLGNLLK